MSKQSMPAGGKVCPKCGEYKSLPSFSKNAARTDGISCWSRACDSKAGKAWRHANPDKAKARVDRWVGDHPDRPAYFKQKHQALRRGIAWEFESFEQWRQWWIIGGYDFFPLKGIGKNKVCMARYKDQGPYSPANAYCTTNQSNSKDAWRNRKERANAN